MTIKVEAYWTKIFLDNSSITPFEGDGKWVAFLRHNFIGKGEKENRTVINQLDKMVKDYNLLGAYVTTKNQDVVVVFTTADRFNIWKVKQIIKKELKVKDDDLLWKAHFETDVDWEDNKGKLWFIDHLVSAYERKEQAILTKRLSKANGIQRNDIEPVISRFRKMILEENSMNRKSMVITPTFESIEYEIDPTMVFVLMPFNEKWSNDILFLIKEVGKKHNLNIVRADDIFAAHNIVNDIWELINKSGLIIADITIHNANVFYELGIAHTLGKDVVLIRQAGGEKTPFDISLWRYFEYELNPTKAEEFKNTLSKVFEHHLVKLKTAT